MGVPVSAVRVRITVPNTEQQHGHPLHEAIVAEAQRQGLAGATAWKATLGSDGQTLRRACPFGFREEVPVVLELVDSDERIQAFLEALRPLVRDRALVAVQPVDAVVFGANRTGRPSHGRVVREAP